MLKAKKAQVLGGLLSDSCAMWQAVAPFMKGRFFVTDNIVYNKAKNKRYTFTPKLPHALYRGDYKVALAKIKKDGPYKFQVEGLE